MSTSMFGAKDMYTCTVHAAYQIYVSLNKLHVNAYV